MLIWLDGPLWRRVWRVSRHTLRQLGRQRPDLAPGCPERLGWHTVDFYRHIWKTRATGRNALARLTVAPPPHLRVVHLNDSAGVRRFLGGLVADQRPRGHGALKPCLKFRLCFCAGLLQSEQMLETLTLRPSELRDLVAVDALLARSYPRLLRPDYPPSVMVTAVPLIAKARPALLTSGTYHLAEMAGEVVGAGGWTRAGPGRADVRHLVCDDRRVRQGIGRALMARILAEAGAAGVRELACQATRTAVPFYQAMGFEVLGAIEVPLRPGIVFPAVLMRRDI